MMSSPAIVRPYKLVLSNGAFKSGSTWLREIVLNLRPFEPVPRQYARRSRPHWVCETRVSQLLADPETPGPILSKSHLFLPHVAREVLMHPNVRVINIQRDLRDAVVSSYYHFLRRRRLRMSFRAYYRTFGRIKVAELCAYHRVWDVDDPKVLKLHFEDLKLEFAESVRRLAAFLEVEVSRADISRIHDVTSIARLRQLRGEASTAEPDRFFRRGAIGDWRDHFTSDDLRDLDRIVESGLTGAPRILYWGLNPVRRTLLRAARRLRLD